MGNNAAAAPALAGIEALTAAVASNASTGAAASTAAAAEGGSVIQAPVSSPGFAAEAGYRLAVMVRDGVTSAQLQLNPAEMGPVTVQIVVDGQTARVHLEAAQADTRQALEAALPQLASNLRDSGLTLTGGGVFDQASQQQNRAADAGNDRSGRQSRGDAGRAAAAAIGVDGPGAASSSSSGVQRRGVVDLVA